MSPHSFFRNLRLMPVGAALAILLPASAMADSVDAEVVNLVSKQIIVESNGSSYHSVSHLANLVADARIRVDTGAVGRVKSWKLWLGLSNGNGDHVDFPTFGKGKSYDAFQRPRRVDRTERLIVPSTMWKSFVLARCNELADDLRAQGLGNTAVFAQDRSLELAVIAHFDADTSGAGSNYFVEGKPWEAHPKTQVICKKWPGASIPQAGTSLGVTPAKVVNKGLSIYEQYGITGVCKIRLDGWITTDQKNTEVSFRYRNQEGKTSQVWSVNTGENKTATFSHWYTINDNGFSESGVALAETGFVRMVGVSHDFKSAWAEYTMECVEGGPGSLTANEPPKLTMQIVEQGKVEVHGYLCPERLKLVGLLEGRGNFSGKVVFFGPGYLAPPHDYSITHGQKLVFGADATLDWSETPPPSPHGPMGQHRSFRLNVTNANDKVVASLPPRHHFAQCRPARLNPVVVPKDGLTVEPRPAGTAGSRKAPAATIRVPQAVPPQPGRPETLQPTITLKRFQKKAD